MHVAKIAMDQVVNCLGDLHGQFHIMADIYHFLLVTAATGTWWSWLETHIR